MLEGLGEDPKREGLLKTPDRVARAMLEMLSGRTQRPDVVLGTDFAGDGYDEMVTLRGISFYSMCEHHLLPFSGTAVVTYIPRDRVVGLSKLARLVDVFGRRLQLQERMTRQIGDALEDSLKPVGWGVAVKASHLCMCARGVSKPGAEMVTTAVGGLLKTDEKARDEFLRLARV